MANRPGEDPITIAELEEIAKRKLASATYNYYASGADEQRALRSNAEASNQLQILPRVLRDVSVIDTSVTIFGQKWSMPLAFSPSGLQKMAGFEGELDAARAAGKFGTNVVLSSSATASMEDVIAAGKSVSADDRSFRSQFWFQLYLTDDMSRNEKLIQRAETAGFKALVITVDTPVLGNRINERKVPVVLPAGIRMENVDIEGTTSSKERKPTINRILMDARSAKEAADILRVAGTRVNSARLVWGDITRLREVTAMKIILKGVMTPEDAELAVQHGADGIIVSNHGGRQLDCTVATIEALPAVASAVRRRIPVFVDGGIRRGSDILKAVALGADAVLIGRPVLWGIAYNGQKGVETVLNIFEREFSRVMALTGVAKVADLDKSYLGVRTGGFGVARL